MFILTNVKGRVELSKGLIKVDALKKQSLLGLG